jgi:hypothetical protein
MSGNWYMHTLGGVPAYYDPGTQVVLGTGKPGVKYLCVSLEQLREEQAASKRWRELQGLSDSAREYGYVVIPRCAFNGP